MKPLVIIKVGDAMEHLLEQFGDFEHWISTAIEECAMPITVVDPRKGDSLPAVRDVSAAIVTGSHSMVTDREPWSEQVAAWLRGAVEQHIPVLGICYGHQLLADALGGEVGYHPAGMELGTVPIKLTEHAQEDPLFTGLPGRFMAQVVHSQSVRRLPEGAVLLASNAFEPHQAFRFGECAWGVQFHPEFSAAAMFGYINGLMVANSLRENTETLLSGVRVTHEAASLLPRFARLAQNR